MRPLFFIERVGARIVRAGRVVAPSLDGMQVTDGAVLHEVPADVQLPAFWRDGSAHAIPPAPSAAHRFDYVALEWVLNLDAAWASVRVERDARLAATDWRVIKAQESGQSLDAVWIAYRQALRDITNQADPLSINWPQQPESAAVL